MGSRAMFASKTLGEHLLRGGVGLGALVVAAFVLIAHPFAALALLALALVSLRGCPMCWTFGLMQTVLARVQRKRVTRSCIGGRCALAPRAEG